MLVERRHLADDVITNAAGSESILCGGAVKGIKLLKKFSPFAGQLVKTDFNCKQPSGRARNASGREAADSTLEYMPKPRRSLANSIRIVLAPLSLCLFGALPAFATDGIYSKFGLDLAYAGRIGYMGGTTPEWAIYVYGAGTASSRFNALDISSRPTLPICRWMATLPWPAFTAP